MFELVTLPDAFNATLEGRRRHHVLTRTVGAPRAGDAVRIAEVCDGNYTGRAAFARVTFVETLSGGSLGPIHVLSLDVRMSTDRTPALRGAPTPVGG